LVGLASKWLLHQPRSSYGRTEPSSKGFKRGRNGFCISPALPTPESGQAVEPVLVGRNGFCISPALPTIVSSMTTRWSRKESKWLLHQPRSSYEERAYRYMKSTIVSKWLLHQPRSSYRGGAVRHLPAYSRSKWLLHQPRSSYGDQWSRSISIPPRRNGFCISPALPTP